METEITKKSVRTVRENQQKDKEARDLSRDLDNLITLKHEKKLRWVWELIQNAVDCAEKQKVNIIIDLKPDKITFTHDGMPFRIEDLVALVTKGSTKSAEGLDGKKGKFGSGFVSTHVLNKLVTVKGIFVNETGSRQFSLNIDRSGNSPDELKLSIEKTFAEIDAVNESAPEQIKSVYTTFEYKLEENKFTLAKQGLKMLERDLPFTLLVNQEELHSVTISYEDGNTVSFTIEEPIPVSQELFFSKIVTTDSEASGLLYGRNNILTIAFPASRNDMGYSLLPVGERARIFRNFPLIGTESFHTPCFIHSELFQPSEPRDGIRTLKEDDSKADKFADENRKVLAAYPAMFNSLFTAFVDNGIADFYLMAESGIPDNSQNYLAIEWFSTNVQKPIREFILKHPLVNTVDGKKIKISESLFLKEQDDGELYGIASGLFASRIPDKSSYAAWKIIIDQDPTNWPDGIWIGTEDIVKEASARGTVDGLNILNIDPAAPLPSSSDHCITWLDKLINYLLKAGRIDLIEKYAIYPNQLKEFRKRADLRIDPGFTDAFKTISTKIFRPLHKDFVLTGLKYQEGIKDFETTDYFNSLNKFLGALDVPKATENQITAIFELCCYSKNDLSKRRKEWFDIVHSLLPSFAKERIITTELNDYDFDSVDKWTLKYVSWIVQNTNTFNSFCQKYFNGDEALSLEWLNRFLNYVCTNEETRETALKYSIILTQDGNFRKYENNLFREDSPDEFLPLFKKLIKEYAGKDSSAYLVDPRIRNEFLPARDVTILTGPIDNIFTEKTIEDEVVEGKKYNKLFHNINEWCAGQDETEQAGQKKLFPIFRGKRSDLSVRAFGKDVSKMLAEKGITEMKALSTLKLPASVLSQLEDAAALAGGHQKLLDKANEIFEEAEKIRRRQEVGKAAEIAFVNAINGIETSFDIENPDVGKDFTIKIPATGREFYIEIKSTIIGQEDIRMSALQGETASKERERYALCVITRPMGMIIEKDYFIEHVKFIVNIGELIGDKVAKMRDEIQILSEHEKGDVNVTMQDKSYSVYVRKKIWEEDGIDFNRFVQMIKEYLSK